MANPNVTLERPAREENNAHSCKENLNGKNSSTRHNHHNSHHKPRQLTILEAVRESKPKSNRALLEHHPVQLEPYTILRGKWLEKAGFTIGQKITVQVSHQQLVITPTKSLSLNNPPTTL